MTPVLSETLTRALGISDKVQYYSLDAGRAWRRKVKAAAVCGLFLCPQPRLGADCGRDVVSRPSKTGRERCASQARSSGLITPKGTDSSSATEAVTSSC